MNDNEIKKLIDSADNPETGAPDISAEEIKSLVIAKIGSENKNSAKTGDEGEAYVSPTFVTAGEKRKPWLKITVAGAAACLGIACVGGYFALAGNGGTALTGGENGTGIVINDPEAETGSATGTKSVEGTGSAPAAEAGEEKVTVMRLLDGTTITTSVSGSNMSTEHSERNNDILELRDGKLWFVGNGENIDVAAAAGDKSYYIYTYFNEYTENEHRVIVSNTAVPADCGYFELYLDEDEDEKDWGRWKAEGVNCFVHSDPPTLGNLVIDYMQWVYDSLGDLGFTPYFAWGDSEYKTDISKIADKSTLVCVTGSAERIFGGPAYQIYGLMDGETIEYYEESDLIESGIWHYSNVNKILEIRDGCLWVNGANGVKLNVTELSEGKEYYIYNNNCAGIESTFVVHNTTVPEECGYFETYKLDGYFGRQLVGRNIEAVGFGFIAAEPNKYKDWVYDALEELGLEIALDYSEETIANDKTVHMDAWELPYEVPVIEEGASQTDGLDVAEEFELMNGDPVRLLYLPNDPVPRLCEYEHKGNGSLFTAENGRVYFIGNNEHIDITDEIGKDKAYIYSYTNPVRNQPHYIAAGGTAENFGYAEIFPMGEDENGIRWAVCKVAMDNADGSPNDFNEGIVMNSVLNRLNISLFNEINYVKPFTLSVDENGVTENITDNADVNPEITIPPLPDGEVLDEEFKLLDGSIVRFSHQEVNGGKIYEHGSFGLRNVDLFANENGRIYFIGNNEHIDITDSIGRDKAYIYTYTHPERNKTHYFIAGGDADNFGYAEVYGAFETDKWEYDGTNSWLTDDEREEAYSDDDLSINEHIIKAFRPWLKSALNELDIIPVVGGSGPKDLSYLFD